MRLTTSTRSLSTTERWVDTMPRLRNDASLTLPHFAVRERDAPWHVQLRRHSPPPQSLQRWSERCDRPEWRRHVCTRAGRTHAASRRHARVRLGKHIRRDGASTPSIQVRQKPDQQAPQVFTSYSLMWYATWLSRPHVLALTLARAGGDTPCFTFP